MEKNYDCINIKICHSPSDQPFLLKSSTKILSFSFPLTMIIIIEYYTNSDRKDPQNSLRSSPYRDFVQES